MKLMPRMKNWKKIMQMKNYRLMEKINLNNLPNLAYISFSFLLFLPYFKGYVKG